jgi:hypothetical protein
MFEGQRQKSPELFIAVASLMQTLFNTETSPVNVDNTIIVDTLNDWKLSASDSAEDSVDKAPPIISTFDIVNLIGWRYHEKQIKEKVRGTANFSL